MCDYENVRGADAVACLAFFGVLVTLGAPVRVACHLYWVVFAHFAFLVCNMGSPLFIFIGLEIGGEYMSVDMPKAVLRHGFGVGFGQPCGRVAGLLGLGGDLQ